MNWFSRLFTRNNTTISELQKIVETAVRGATERNSLGIVGNAVIVQFEPIENGWLLRYSQRSGHAPRTYFAESQIEAAEKLLAQLVADKLEAETPKKPSHTEYERMKAQMAAARNHIVGMSPATYPPQTTLQGLLGAGEPAPIPPISLGGLFK